MNTIRKELAVLTILFFIGLAVAPSINANLERTSHESSNLIEEQYDNLELSCHYITLNRILEINKIVSAEDAELLFQLMDGSDIEAIATKLENLELIPKSMSLSEVKDLIDGNCVDGVNKETFENRMKYILPDNNSEWSENIICNVQGEGVDSYYTSPIGMILHLLLYLTTIIITLPFNIITGICWLISDIFDDANILTLLSLLLLDLGITFAEISNIFFRFLYFILERGQIFNPTKISSIVYIKLYDACNQGFPYLNVSGLKGNWTLYNKRIDLIMIGFTGIWISIKDQVQVPGCNFIGRCLYATAREMDDWVPSKTE